MICNRVTVKREREVTNWMSVVLPVILQTNWDTWVVHLFSNLGGFWTGLGARLGEWIVDWDQGARLLGGDTIFVPLPWR